MTSAKPWYQTFFHDFRPLFGILPQKRTHEHIRFIIKKLGLRKGSRFLDCPCGIGRIALPLAAKGIRVTGVDLSQEYLDELAATAKKRRLKIELERADMRRVTFDRRFDAAANLWTSFGYFENDAEEMKTIRAMYRALKPGGKFLLHVINRDYIIAHYTPSDVIECGDVFSFEERKFDYATSVNKGVWRFLKDGKLSSHNIGIRMYSYHELIAMFRKAGFVDIEGFGGTKDEPISRDSSMMFVVGTRPE
ncbi:MAG: methyltransferase domain-containing protein [Candidatus Zixiibacteriota bacterium]